MNRLTRPADSAANDPEGMSAWQSFNWPCLRQEGSISYNLRIGDKSTRAVSGRGSQTGTKPCMHPHRWFYGTHHAIDISLVGDILRGDRCG
jgi:hypothetical protein